MAGLIIAALIAGAPLAGPALAQEAEPVAAAMEAAPAVESMAVEVMEEAAAVEEAAPEVTLMAHQAALELDSAGTAWILTSTALVLLMTIPGLALFYGGMVRRKSVIGTVAQLFAITCVVTVVWMGLTYGMAFGVNPNAGLNQFIGSFNVILLNGVTIDTAFASAPGLPEFLWIVYQMTFAIITPAIIAGAFAERMKFSAMMLFMVLWSIFVYAPIAHWVWGGGWLSDKGVLDFAGGTVVHINAGVAGSGLRARPGQAQGLWHREHGSAQPRAHHDRCLAAVGWLVRLQRRLPMGR